MKRSLRPKAKYGQLHESSSQVSVSSCAFDDSSKASSSADDTKSFATAATAIGIGLDGQVIVQETKISRRAGVAKPTAPSQGLPDTISEEKGVKKKSKAPKNGTVIGWQRNPTKASGTKPACMSSVEDKRGQPKTPSTPKRSQAGEERRKRRKEIILGWQRNPITAEAKIAGALSTPYTATAPGDEAVFEKATSSQHSNKSTEGRKKSEEQGSSRRLKNGKTSDAGPSRKKHPSDLSQNSVSSDGKRNSEGEGSTRRIKSGSGSSKKGQQPGDRKNKEDIKGGEESTSESLRPGAPATGTPPPLSSRKASHLRVYSGNRENRERQRSRSRGAKRRTNKSREDAILQWKREPATKATSVEGKVSERVDKSTLGEVAKRLEIQKKYEEDKREAIGKLRGRRYRSGGPISNAEASSRRGVGSRSPGPTRRGRSTDRDVDNVEEQFTWLREPAQSTRSSSRPRRRPSRSLSGSDLKGVNSADAKSRRRLSRTYSGDKVDLIDSAEAQSRRRTSSRPLLSEKDKDSAVDLS